MSNQQGNNAHTGDPPNAGTSHPGHEPNTISLRAVWICLAVLLGLIIGSLPAVSWLLGESGGNVRPAVSLSTFDPGSARNWNNPEADLAALRREEDEHLNRFGWGDHDQGLVRIPITEAMEILAERNPVGSREGRLPSPATSTKGTDNETEEQP